jgi:hypothetical protein
MTHLIRGYLKHTIQENSFKNKTAITAFWSGLRVSVLPYNQIMDSKTLDWLLEGDPAIRWQVRRDLLDEKPKVVRKERTRTANESWGARLLALQDSAGTWGGGLYSPKWISTTYTLLLLRHIGIPPGNTQARKACMLFLAKGLEWDGGINLFSTIKYSETCVNGMLVALLSYFQFNDERIHNVVDFLLREQMADGGWNCRRGSGATHGSFHTTISVLEGLAEYVSTYPQRGLAVKSAVEKAHEFLLIHHLYKSHRTGKVVDSAMTRLTFPPRWHYDFLRALDYFQSVNAPKDERMRDAIDLLLAKRNADGCGTMNKPWAGRVFFDMEETGQPSRWNTLRALRVLRWWEKG